MTDDAHHMSLLTLLIQGVAHSLAVDGQTLISRAIDFVPALQGLVQMRGGDADQPICAARTRWARHNDPLRDGSQSALGTSVRGFAPNRKWPCIRACHIKP